MNSTISKIVFLALLLFAGRTASADTISYILGTGNSAITPAPYSPFYGSVLVNRTSTTTATITFTADAGYMIFDSGAAAVNLNATTWSLSSLSGTLFSGAATPQPTSGGSGQEDGFGNFNQTFTQMDGYNDAMTAFSFIVTDTSGTWSSAANVLTGNSQGNLVAAHIGICNVDPCTSGGAAGGFFSSTGFAGETGSVISPEPRSLWLLGTAFLILPVIGLRRKVMSASVAH
ncbi:MAG TPA: hypothetical protein VGN01_05740 [Acidobacteriaceae bacterium]|jgi:hypothetical protein